MQNVAPPFEAVEEEPVHVPEILHDAPEGQEPHEPPHPSGPHVLPEHAGTQALQIATSAPLTSRVAAHLALLKAVHAESAEQPGKQMFEPCAFSTHQFWLPYAFDEPSEPCPPAQSASEVQGVEQNPSQTPDEHSSSELHAVPSPARQCEVAHTLTPCEFVGAQQPLVQSEFFEQTSVHTRPLPKSMQRLLPCAPPQQSAVEPQAFAAAVQSDPTAPPPSAISALPASGLLPAPLPGPELQPSKSHTVTIHFHDLSLERFIRCVPLLP